MWISGWKMINKKAGYTNIRGYVVININDGNIFLAHRLAWLYVYGQMPSKHLDHINGIRHDNRIANLRECSSTENSWNSGLKKANKSGFKGVSWHRGAGKWQAHINIGGKGAYLGIFETAELASAAYIFKAKETHGEFYRETTILKENV